MLSRSSRKSVIAILLLQVAALVSTPRMALADEGDCDEDGWCCNSKVGNCKEGQTYCCFWQDNKVVLETCGCTNET